MTPACRRTGGSRPGVAHQYCGALGKTANCQVLVSVNAATDRASCPLGWRLFLPESWDQDEDRRERARIPEDVRHVPKWQLALGIIDELLGWGLERRGGAGRRRLRRHHRVPDRVWRNASLSTSCRSRGSRPRSRPTRHRSRPPIKAWGGRGSRATPRRRSTCGRWRSPPAASTSTRSAGVRVTAARSPASSSRSESAPPTTPNARTTACSRSAGCSPSGPRARTSRSSTGSRTCPADTPLLTLVRLAKLRWRVEHDYRELKQCLGLDHYEGRTYRGLHHHLTCVTVAHAFLTCCRLHRDPGRPQLAAA